MNPAEKALLTTAFEALGPERVTRDLKATGHSWSDCVLALAISGEPDALAREMEKARQKKHAAGALIGVPAQVMNEVIRLWDHDEQSFRELVAEWLEFSRAATATAPTATAWAQP